MIRVKICGITRLEDALYAQESGADALGFIFYKKSKRYIETEQVAKISKELNPFISKVGVFVDEDPALINKICSQCGLTHVQLHGQEPVELAARINRVVIKALNYSEQLSDDIRRWNDYNILIDSGTKDLPGGTGHTLPWEKLKNIKPDHGIILAGGLNVSNVQKAIEIMNPMAVDVNSGVEKSPGLKDHDLVKKIIEIVKGL